MGLYSFLVSWKFWGVGGSLNMDVICHSLWKRLYTLLIWNEYDIWVDTSIMAISLLLLSSFVLFKIPESSEFWAFDLHSNNPAILTAEKWTITHPPFRAFFSILSLFPPWRPHPTVPKVFPLVTLSTSLSMPNM